MMVIQLLSIIVLGSAVFYGPRQFSWKMCRIPQRLMVQVVLGAYSHE